MKRDSAFLGIALAGIVVAGGAMLLRRQAASSTSSTRSTAPRAPWEPAAYRGGPGLPDYLAFVSREYYGDDRRAIVLDARDARAQVNPLADGAFNPES